MSDPPEPRFVADLAVRVFGMDAVGRPFSRNAHTLDISDRGARLSGLEAKLLVGDVIGVQLGDSKARCRVIWVTGPALPIDAGVANRVGTAVSVGAAAGGAPDHGNLSHSPDRTGGEGQEKISSPPNFLSPRNPAWAECGLG